MEKRRILNSKPLNFSYVSFFKGDKCISLCNRSLNFNVFKERLSIQFKVSIKNIKKNILSL